MKTYQAIKISKGSGGFGGPLVITPTEEKIRLCILQVAKNLILQIKLLN